MTNYVFIQSSGMGNNYIDQEYELFSKVPNITLVCYGVIPFTNPKVLTGLSDLVLNKEDKVFIRGGVFLTDKNFIIPDNPDLTKRLLDSVYHDDKSFNMDYLQSSGYHLTSELTLNNHYHVYNCKALKNTIYTTDVFIKPVDDRKQFPGVIVPKGKTLEEIVTESNTLSTNWYDCKILINMDVHDIETEYRIFVVNGMPITGSRYFKNNIINPQILDFSSNNLYTSLIKQFLPNRKGLVNTYVIDLAVLKTPEFKLKVIEYNCINCSGLYKSDAALLIQHLFK